VARPRLTALLHEDPAPFTLVVAGPGYGKTIAVNQWLEAAAVDVGWVSLDRSDDRPQLFWRYVTEAVSGATGGVGDEALLMLAEEQELEGAIASLLADLERVDRPLVIVLDDLHVIRSAGILADLGGFVNRLPATVRFVATSRVDPQLPLGRWRAAGTLAEIRQGDLRFDVAEASMLVERAGVVPLGEGDDQLLVERTEGWAAGLQLALLSLRTRSDPSEYLQTSLGGDRGIVDYLVGEVLDTLSDDDRELVLDLSVLSDFDIDLAAAVTRRDDTGLRLRSLEARNLFLLPSDGGGDRFRFHQLMRDLLLAELRWRSPARVPELHRAAARHLEATGALQEAAVHLVAAGDLDQAYGLVARPAWELLDDGEVLAVHRWLDLFPDDVVGDDIDRVLSYLALLIAAGRAEEVDRWITRLDVDRAARSLSVTQTVQLLAGQAFAAHIRGDLEESDRTARRCLELLGEDQLHGPVLERLAGLLARHAIDRREFDAAARWVARSGIPDSPSLVLRHLLPTMLAARLAEARGDLDEAARCAQDVLDTAREHGVTAVAPVGEAHVILAAVLLERCQYVAAEEQAVLAAAAGELRRLTVVEVQGRLLAVEATAARFGPEAALTLLTGTRRAFEHRRLGATLVRWLDEAEARLLLLDADVRAAAPIIVSLPSSTTRCLLAARAARSSGDLVAMEEHLAGIGRPTPAEQVERLLLTAPTRSTPDAHAQVRTAAVLAVDHGLVHTFLREGADVVRLARRAQQIEPTPALDALLAEVAPARGPSRVGSFAEPLTERELRLLLLLPTHLTYREMADELCVSINTVKTHQKGLFRKMAVSRRSEAVAAGRRAGIIDL
jgi:LuxR family maltose regulon positive regulatory protein